MPTKIKSLLSSQSGYMMFFLIAALALVMLFFIQIPYSPVKIQNVSSTCIHNLPLTSDSFQYEGETFDLLKKQAPIIGVQSILHTHRAQIIKVGGKDRQVTRPEGEAGVSNWFTGDALSDPLWHNLRFVNVTEDVSSRPPGTRFFDIYIKRGAEIPPNIIAFCQQNTVDLREFMSDNNDKSFPPRQIDASTIGSWSDGADPAHTASTAPKSGIFYLYAYDTDTMEPIIQVKRRNAMPVSNIYIEGKSYRVVYYGGWESKHIRLETTDPMTGIAIGYRYANPERLTIPEDPYKFLNETKTATDTLQIQAFSPWKIPPAGWWTPECKPAIYLYPKTAMNVNVKVYPQGHFTYTDPIYNEKTGWNVKAYPSGKLEWLHNEYGVDSKGEKRSTNLYDYLYYESKIHDSMINKPTEGFMVKYEDLETFYQTTLPKLGLNGKETKDYIEYWTKALPQASYYFVGILGQENINQIEPLEITPKPDLITRVRLYYEALDQPKEVKSPVLDSRLLPLATSQFKVVEWGGMVKQDKNHPFTCSM